MLTRFYSKVSLVSLEIGLSAAVILAAIPDLAYADLESSIRNVRTELSMVVLPTLSVIGLLVASFSYLTGNQNAKQHITYALIGAGVGFGAQSIIDFISSMVH
jgi:hypothetical protein